MLIFLGKVYLGQRDTSNLEINAEHKAIAITPNVLERLQASYKLTMQEVRMRSGALTDAQAPASPGETPGVVPRNPHRVSKPREVLRNSDSESSDDGGRGEL